MARMGAGPAPVAPGAAPGSRVGRARFRERPVRFQVRGPVIGSEGRAFWGTQGRPGTAGRGLAGEPSPVPLRPGTGRAVERVVRGLQKGRKRGGQRRVGCFVVVVVFFFFVKPTSEGSSCNLLVG